MDLKQEILVKDTTPTKEEKENEKPKEMPLIDFKKYKVQCGGSTFEIYQQYELLRNIGIGAFGIVCSGKDKINKIDIAVKKIPGIFRDIKDAKRILREIKLLKFFDHPHIVKLLDIVLPDDVDSYKDYYLIFSLMHTDLQRIITSKQVLQDKKVKYCMYQIISGLYYMHSANIIHRDLKPNNIFINSNCHVKIGDLNLARKQEPENITDQTNYVVQRWYRAPEVLLSSSEYTSAIDIWSLGCILAELLGRIILFQGSHHQEQVEKIVAVLGKPKPEDLPYEIELRTKEYLDLLPERDAVQWTDIFPFANPLALDLLKHMLVYNPEKRYTIQECIKHPYFEELYAQFPPKECSDVFDWSFDTVEYNEQTLRKVLYDEALLFQQKHKNNYEQK